MSTNINDIMKVSCPKCKKVFKETAGRHLAGAGCPDCFPESLLIDDDLVMDCWDTPHETEREQSIVTQYMTDDTDIIKG